MSAQTAAQTTPRRHRGFNLEKWGWVFMRGSGVLLVVLIFGHLFTNLMLGEGIHGLTFDFIANKFENPFWRIWDILLLWLAMIHGSNGMRTIVNDYVTREGLRKGLLWAIGVAAALLIVLGTFVIVTFNPELGATAEGLLSTPLA